MASSTSSLVLMMMPLTHNQFSSSNKSVSFLNNPLPNLKPTKLTFSPIMSSPKFQVKSSYNMNMEKAVSGLAAAALTVSMAIPEVAEAAGSGVSPSLKNFLLSIAAGGVVLTVIIGVVVGVSNFDPVKRG
ncbi:unnamed protein product [Cochlearia groenlandica]